MSSDVLEILISHNPGDGAKIEKIWKFCQGLQPGPYDARVMAIELKLPEDTVVRLLNEFCNCGLLIRNDFVRCKGCEEDYEIVSAVDKIECDNCGRVLNESNATEFSVYKMPATLCAENASPPYQKETADETNQQPKQTFIFNAPVGSVVGRDNLGAVTSTINQYNNDLKDTFELLLTELINSGKQEDLKAVITDIEEIKRLLTEHGINSDKNPHIIGLWDKTKKILSEIGLAANNIQLITGLFAKVAPYLI